MKITYVDCVVESPTHSHTLHTMAINKRPNCYPRTPYKGGTQVPAVGEPGRLSKLISSIDGVVKKHEDPFVPFYDINIYIEGLRKDGRSDEYIESVIEKQEAHYTNNPIKSGRKHVEPIISNIIDDSNPLNGLHKKNITFKEIIEIYKNAGYSDTFIDRIIAKREKYLATIESTNEYIDEVLSRYSGKPPARKKKIELRGRMATMYKNKNVIKIINSY